MTDLRQHKAEWDRLGEADPLWAILSDPARKFGRWDEAAFFRTGEEEIAGVVATARELGLPGKFATALDFGCGVGRLSRALATRFERVKGVDVSASMIARARQLNAHVSACEFLVNDRADLALFGDATFDFFYSNIVLQHLPGRDVIFGYVGEFLRTLAPGGLLVFQLPSRLPPLVRLQPRRTLFRLLRAVGLSESTLYWKLGLHPIRMRHVPRPRMESFLEGKGGRLLRVDTTRDDYFPVESSVYYVTRD